MLLSIAGPPCGALSLMRSSRPPSSCQGNCFPQQRCPLLRSHVVAAGEDGPEVSTSCDHGNRCKGAAEGVTLSSCWVERSGVGGVLS